MNVGDRVTFRNKLGGIGGSWGAERDGQEGEIITAKPRYTAIKFDDGFVMAVVAEEVEVIA